MRDIRNRGRVASVFLFIKIFIYFFVCRVSVCCGGEGIVAVRIDAVRSSEIGIEVVVFSFEC